LVEKNHSVRYYTSCKKGAFKINDDGARRLSAAIIVQAAEDLSVVYKKTMRLHKECYRGGKCNYGRLIDYLVNLKQKQRISSLPFEVPDGLTAIRFFRDDYDWGQTLLALSGIDALPATVKDMVTLLDDAHKRCAKCIDKYKPFATKRIKTAELNAAE
jgi:hypothetical protein